MTNETDIHNFTGLTEQEAALRLKEDGPNELPSSRRRGALVIAFDVIREPMFMLLVIAAMIYASIGQKEESIMLSGFVLVILGITFYQERKTERALDTLKNLSSPRALVTRENKQKRISGSNVARGDIIIFYEGDRVAADAQVLSCSNLSVDESLLTGESVPVQKFSQGLVYSGTMVVQGSGIARVTVTGIRTEMGKIGKSLQTIESRKTPLQKETDRLVRTFASIGLLISAMVVTFYGITRNNWTDGFLAGIALAMAILPEEFPMVLTIFLALGAWRLSCRQVLARQMPVIETLGAATVLCVDKTGTLTQNRMSVRAVSINNDIFPPDGSAELSDLAEFGILASQEKPIDPAEKAIRQWGNSVLKLSGRVHNGWTMAREYPLGRNLLAMSRAWKLSSGNEFLIATKGAPEAIIDLCHMDDNEKRIKLSLSSRMASDGMRVLGVAKSRFNLWPLPTGQHDFTFEFIGFIGLEDPLRPAVANAAGECCRAGIRVIMITGDYPLTASSIARKIGLANPDAWITGDELNSLSESALARKIKTVSLFARALPEQKLRIVRALQKNGEIVAMTGDGINDSPALKAADIGIAMGGRGTDVARESASLVILDDDFSSIVHGIKTGRRIYDNLKKAMSYIIAVHFPIAGISLLPVVFGLPLVLLPVHIVFLELIIDPACSIVFETEPEEKDIMLRRPRQAGKPIFGKREIMLSVLQGTSVLAIVLAVYLTTLLTNKGELDARTLTFTTLIIANLALIITNRSWSRNIFQTLRLKNNSFLVILTTALTLLAMVLYVPPLKRLFKFGTLHPDDIIISVTAGIISILWFEILKSRHRKPFRGQRS